MHFCDDAKCVLLDTPNFYRIYNHSFTESFIRSVSQSFSQSVNQSINR